MMELPCSWPDFWPKVESNLGRPINTKEELVATFSALGAPEFYDRSAMDSAISGLEQQVSGFHFYGDVLKSMQEYALDLPRQFAAMEHKLFLLRTNVESSVVLTRTQIRSLLAFSFFRAVGEPVSKTHPFGHLCWDRLTAAYLSDNCAVERLKCLFYYFYCEKNATSAANTVLSVTPSSLAAVERRRTELVSFSRFILKEQPDWITFTNTKICEVRMSSEKLLEDFQEADALVDFANMYLMIGQIIPSCTQEEVLFSVRQELLVSILLSEKLEDNEAIIMRGGRVTSNYTGYLRTFKFAPLPSACLPSTDTQTVIAIDASVCHKYSLQFQDSVFHRDLNKAYLGFLNADKDPVGIPLGEITSGGEGAHSFIATGLWGCGAFGGDPVLKFLQQVLAASSAEKNLCFSTFNNPKLQKELESLLCAINTSTVADVYKVMVEYCALFPKADTGSEESRSNKWGPESPRPKIGLSQFVIQRFGGAHSPCAEECAGSKCSLS